MTATVSPALLAVPGLGGFALVLAVALGLMLLGSSRVGPHLAGRAAQPDGRPSDFQGRQRFVLWLAEGCGAGRIPVAPGTMGSVIGLAWTLVLVAPRSAWWCGLGLMAGLALSVALCAAAERLLGARDPGSVVLDEIAALPLCFAGWVGYSLWRTGQMPAFDGLVSGRGWLLLLAGYGAFRAFDIWKPWPIRQSQALPGGWGVTVDDVLAAVWANIIWLPCLGLGWFETR